jgi:cell division protein FtsB
MTDLYVYLALQFVWTVGLTIYTMSRRPGEDAIGQARVAQQAVDVIKGRVDVLEAHVSHLPDGEEVSALRTQLAGVEATLKAMAENVQATKAAVALIDQYLRTRGHA